MTTTSTALATFDSRPFFDKALHYGVAQGIIFPERLQTIQEDFAKGMVQIANFFGTAHLRPELELALHRMVNLVSLYLEDFSGGDLQMAASSLRDKSFLSHSKAGSDMLKRLHAMPDSTLMRAGPVSPEGQRAYLDEKTAARSIPLAEYQSELALRQAHQRTIDFAFWLAKKMGADRDEIDDADSLIRSAMLVVFVAKAELRLPTRTAFVQLIKAASNAKAKLDENRMNAFFKEAPAEFQSLAQRSMQYFTKHDLAQIRVPDNSADKLLHGEYASPYFVRESLDENAREYDRLVAREWHRVTHGEADDPAVLATVFLFLATGLPPKASILLKEGKEVIRIFRNAGFDSPAVIDFIDQHAPESSRESLRRVWQEDFKSEAEQRLADIDQNDTYMERALEYLRETCRATWKSSRR